MRLSDDRALRSVLIAGSGLEAWLTAAYLALRLDGRRVDITVCPVTGSQEWDALYTTLPAFPGDLFRDLGYSDLKLAKLADASFSLGTRVTGPGLDEVIKPHGPVGINVGGVAFHQYWRRVTARLEPDDYFRYSPGTEAMRRDAFAPPVAANAIGPLQHEMVRHIDPWALQKHLRHQAYDRGVKASAAPLAEVVRTDDGSRISHLVTGRGESLSADLYIDCSGPLRRLRGGEDSWQPAPFSRPARLWAEHTHRQKTPRPWSSLFAQDSGWRLVLPRGSEEVTLRIDESAAPDKAMPYRAGHLPRPWAGNCVALGSAAASLLPVDCLPPRLLLGSLERLVKLLPGRDCHATETCEYNQLSNEDAQEAHSLGAVFEAWRQGLDLVAAAEAGELPEDLALRIRLFARRGWLSPRDSLLVPEDSWRSAYILLGVIPAHHDRLADRIDFDQVQDNLLALKQKVRQVARTFPTYDEYFAAVRSAAAEARP